MKDRDLFSVSAVSCDENVGFVKGRVVTSVFRVLEGLEGAESTLHQVRHVVCSANGLVLDQRSLYLTPRPPQLVFS